MLIQRTRRVEFQHVLSVTGHPPDILILGGGIRSRPTFGSYGYRPAPVNSREQPLYDVTLVSPEQNAIDEEAQGLSLSFFTFR